MLRGCSLAHILLACRAEIQSGARSSCGLCVSLTGLPDGSLWADALTSSTLEVSNRSQDASNATQQSGGTQQVGSISSVLLLVVAVLVFAQLSCGRRWLSDGSDHSQASCATCTLVFGLGSGSSSARLSEMLCHVA